MATILRIFPRNRHSIVRVTCAVLLVMVGCSLLARSSTQRRTPYDVIRDVIPDFPVRDYEFHETDDEIPNNITIVNPHPFHIILAPQDLCHTQDKLLAMIYIHSRPDSFHLRDYIRHTWGNMSRFSPDIRIAFVLGTMPERTGLQIALAAEAHLYNDIIQEDFVDSYKNLTYKAICALRWVSKHCAHAQYILKVDDDVLVDTFTLVRVLKSMSQAVSTSVHTGKLWCRVWMLMRVQRTGKWHVDMDEYSGDIYPPYCSGMAYMMTSDVARALYVASLSVPFFWVDDVYVTGMLPQQLSLGLTDLQYYFVLRPENMIREKYVNADGHNSPIFAHVGGAMFSARKMWEDVVELESHVGKRGTPGLMATRSKQTTKSPASTTVFTGISRPVHVQPDNQVIPWR